nr:hypothetical protein CFP56_63136 [Quercus suber]
MCLERMQTLPSLHLPNMHRFIERPRQYQIRLEAEVDIEDQIGVALQGLDVGGVTSGGVRIPDAESVVVRGGADVVGVGGPSKVRDALGVAGEAVEESQGLGGPDDEGFV